MNAFADVPATGTYWLTNAQVPGSLLANIPHGAREELDNLFVVDLKISDGSVAAVEAPGTAPAGAPALDLDGGQVWSGHVDLHTHIDKGHTWPRAQNADGTHAGARAAVQADRERSYAADEVRRRMEFSLASAYAHGTRAIRTHLDSIPPNPELSWPVFAEVHDAWAGRVELQAVSLIHLPLFEDRKSVAGIADVVADTGGIFGAVSSIHDNAEELIDLVFTLAAERNLDLDFHVDETLDPRATTLRTIAEAARRHDFQGQVNCGHCCAFSVQDEDYVEATLDVVAETNISIVSLPMCNMYLQDRGEGRTPRNRGVTLLHEFQARGVPVAVASDNTRDPFYGFGDLDMHEVFTQATRIAHLDRPYADWPKVATVTPASVMGLSNNGVIAPGAPADLVLYRGRGFSELLSRPQLDRIVLRNGKAIDTTVPDYRELD
ncbi:MAG: cytosine deaminase, partial [Alphaproteobacteria bacterium]|nr:cytosine deaminase [Alphaproteobacteria bacterium]